MSKQIQKVCNELAKEHQETSCKLNSVLCPTCGGFDLVLKTFLEKKLQLKKGLK